MCHHRPEVRYQSFAPDFIREANVYCGDHLPSSIWTVLELSMVLEGGDGSASCSYSTFPSYSPVAKAASSNSYAAKSLMPRSTAWFVTFTVMGSGWAAKKI